MTLRSSDAQSANSLPRRPRHTLSPSHAIPEPVSSFPPSQAASPAPLTPPSFVMADKSGKTDHEHALDLATRSWDLATGGLKVLTAKRELPVRPDRRSPDAMPDIVATSRSYLFALVVLVCVVLMLIGGGIVLLVMLQP